MNSLVTRAGENSCTNRINKPICNLLPPRVFVFTHEMPLYALEKRLSLLVANYSVKAIEARNSTARVMSRVPVPSNSLCSVNKSDLD